MAHFVLGAVGFVALIAACLVFARRYDRSGERNWAVISAGTGVVLLGAFVGIASGPPRHATVLGLWIAVALSWLWLAAVARRSMGISSSDHDFARRSPRAGRRVAHRVPDAEHERRLP
jgi:MFS family permease